MQVYLVSEEDEHKLQIFGLLIGSHGMESTIYLAVSVSWAVKQLVEDRRLRVRDIIPVSLSTVRNFPTIVAEQESAAQVVFQQTSDL